MQGGKTTGASTDQKWNEMEEFPRSALQHRSHNSQG